MLDSIYLERFDTKWNDGLETGGQSDQMSVWAAGLRLEVREGYQRWPPWDSGESLFKSDIIDHPADDRTGWQDRWIGRQDRRCAVSRAWGWINGSGPGGLKSLRSNLAFIVKTEKLLKTYIHNIHAIFKFQVNRMQQLDQNKLKMNKNVFYFEGLNHCRSLRWCSSKVMQGEKKLICQSSTNILSIFPWLTDFKYWA